MKTNPKESVFPSNPAMNNLSEGLTKREYFAALALQGILSHTDPSVWGKTAAERAVKAADALIEELNKE